MCSPEGLSILYTQIQAAKDEFESSVKRRSIPSLISNDTCPHWAAWAYSHWEVRKLNYFFSVDLRVDNSDQTGARRKDSQFRVFGSKARFEFGRLRVLIDVNRKDLRNLLDIERASRYGEELEDTMRVFPLLLVEALQCPFVRLI